MADQKQSFWKTLPGILTGLAALLTAVVGLIAVWPNGAEPSTPGVGPGKPSPTDETLPPPPPPPAIQRGDIRLVLVKPKGTQGCTSKLKVTVGDTTAEPTAYPFDLAQVPLGNVPYEVEGKITCPMVASCLVHGEGFLTVKSGSSYNLQWEATDPRGECRATIVR